MAAEVVAVLFCMPGYSTFEYASGALFGFYVGTIMVSTAKCIAAIVAYVLIRQLNDGPAGRWVQQRVQGNRNGGAQWSQRLRKGIERNGFRFCLLVRCSLLPAWLGNYTLPLAGVPFSTYFSASVLGMLPPVATNVYAGAAAASLASMLSGGSAGSGSSLLGFLAMATSVAGSSLLVHQLACYAREESSEAGEGLP